MVVYSVFVKSASILALSRNGRFLTGWGKRVNSLADSNLAPISSFAELEFLTESASRLYRHLLHALRFLNSTPSIPSLASALLRRRCRRRGLRDTHTRVRSHSPVILWRQKCVCSAQRDAQREPGSGERQKLYKKQGFYSDTRVVCAVTIVLNEAV